MTWRITLLVPTAVVLTFLTLPAASSPATGPAANDRALGDIVRSYVDELSQSDRFSGAVSITRRGEPVLFAAWGLANKSFDVPNRVDTKFSLGSMNKMFTAVAIAQLEEQGKLSYDDTVGKHLPDYPNADVRDKVTIHHLLTHTSGMGGDIFSDDWMRGSKTRYRTIDQVMQQFVNEPMRFEPGAQFAYCNAGFIVLGKIVEQASGRGYYEYIREHIYEPAGMTASDSYELDDPVPNLAVGYTHDRYGDGTTTGSDQSGSKRYCNTFLRYVRGSPAGGGYSTVEDLQRFAQALQGGKLVKPQTLAKMTSEHADMGKSIGGSMHYGYGFREKLDRRGRRSFGHEGSIWGVSAAFYIYPDDGYVLAVLSNYDGATPAVVRRFGARLPQQEG
jgi:CubicO group peptidase (beta-lactamase class C family)